MLIKKIPDTSGLVNTILLSTKINEVENKIPDTSCLVTTAVLNTRISEVENKTSNHDKSITTPKFNNLTAENFAARLKQANLVTKTDFDKNQQAFIKKFLQIKQNI